MTGLFGTFATDSDKEETGIAVEFPEAENSDGTIPTFWISRMGRTNKAYTKAFERASRPYRRQVELGTLKNEVAEGLLLDVFVDTILLDWENVKDASGDVLGYSKQTAKELMAQLPDLYDRLQVEAKEISNFRAEALEAEAKN